MATNNAINKDFPLQVSEGGTGNVSLTDHAVLLGNGTNPISTLPVGQTGEALIYDGLTPFVWGNEINNNFSLRLTSAGVNPILTVSNTDNTSSATSSATILITNGGSSAGNPYVDIQPSVGDGYVLVSNGSSLTLSTGSNAAFSISSSGEINKTGTSAISVQNDATRANITGASQTYVIPYDLVNYDQRNNYLVPSFTAPVDGTYLITIGCRATNISTGQGGMPRMLAPTQIVGAMQTYTSAGNVKTGSSVLTWSSCVIFELDATDTVRGAITYFNGSTTIDLLANPATFMAITLLG